MPYKQKHKPLSRPRELAKREHKHYWPYLPFAILSIGLLAVMSLSGMRAQNVLGTTEGVTQDGLLRATNEARRDYESIDLSQSTKLSKAAQAKAADMVKRDYWSHETPEGKMPWSFMDTQSYSYRLAGENLAYGFSDSEEVIRGWLNSPSHRENLLSSDFEQVGFGIAQSENFQGDGPETVVVALYATPGQLASSSDTGRVLAGQTGETFGITRLETMFGSSGSVAVFIVGSTLSLVVGFMIARHVLLFRHLLKRSESFVLHHPMLDVTIISLCIFGAFLAQTSGFVR
jgi:hypothetical protein